MWNQRFFRFLIFGLLVGAVLLWANQLSGRKSQIVVELPEPVQKMVNSVTDAALTVATSVVQSDQVQTLKGQVLGRFVKEKDKIVKDQIGSIIKEIKSLPENQLEDFKAELCHEVCSE